jgi:N-acetylmuramoyl-L-alanine amidase
VTRDLIRSQIDDRTALICTLYGEAAGESIHSKVGVACVIRNRVLADLNTDGLPNNWWGNSFRDVCLKPWQFSCWWETNQNTERVYSVAAQLLTGLRPKDYRLVDEIGWIADGIIGDAVRDVTNGATHYLTVRLLTLSPPSWVKGATRIATIGSHAYFKDVP